MGKILDKIKTDQGAKANRIKNQIAIFLDYDIDWK